MDGGLQAKPESITHEADAYYANVVPFQAQRARRYRRLVRIMATALAVFAFLNAGQTVAIIEMLPLVRTVPMFIHFRDDGTPDAHFTFSALPPDKRVAAIEASIWAYVHQRERWNAADAKDDYDIISAMSAPGVRSAYQDFANSRDPENPAVKFGRLGFVNVERISGSFLPGHADDFSSGVYQIDFCRIVEAQGAKPVARHMVVGVEYTVADKIPLVERVSFNPDGVIVMSYPGPTPVGAPRPDAQRCG